MTLLTFYFPQKLFLAFFFLVLAYKAGRGRASVSGVIFKFLGHEAASVYMKKFSPLL